MESDSPGGLGSLNWSESESGSSSDGKPSPDKLHRRLVDTASVVSVVARERNVLTEALTQSELETFTLKEIILEREDRVRMPVMAF